MSPIVTSHRRAGNQRLKWLCGFALLALLLAPLSAHATADHAPSQQAAAPVNGIYRPIDTRPSAKNQVYDTLNARISQLRRAMPLLKVLEVVASPTKLAEFLQRYSYEEIYKATQQWNNEHLSENVGIPTPKYEVLKSLFEKQEDPAALVRTGSWGSFPEIR